MLEYDGISVINPGIGLCPTKSFTIFLRSPKASIREAAVVSRTGYDSCV